MLQDPRDLNPIEHVSLTGREILDIASLATPFPMSLDEHMALACDLLTQLEAASERILRRALGQPEDGHRQAS